MEDDWGDADATALYTKALGFKPAVGNKVFFEMYWMDTSTGFTGVSLMDNKICESEEDAAEEGYVKRNKITMDDIKPDSHVSECDVDFSTGAPVISFDAVCLGYSNVASSKAYLEEDLPADCIGTSMVLARGMGEGNAWPPSLTSSGCATPVGMAPLSPLPTVAATMSSLPKFSVRASCTNL